jgi:hypothetical protein
MKTLQLRSFWVVLGMSLMTLGYSAVARSTSATESHAAAPAVEQGAPSATKAAGLANEGLRSIVNEEEIPAFLRTDPCDTND